MPCCNTRLSDHSVLYSATQDMDCKLHKNLDNDIVGQFGKTLPIKLEVDFALVEEQGGGGDHGKDCIKPIVSGHLQLNMK